MYTRNRYFLYVLIALFIVLPSCKKFVEVELSPEYITTEEVFTTDQTALAAVSGLYTQMRLGLDFTNGGLSLYGGLLAGEVYNTATNANYDPYYQNALQATTSSVHSNFWAASYKGIYRCNAILEGLQRSQTISDGMRQTLTGEVKLVRGLYYFYLTNLFGDVPLVLSTDYEANQALPRSAAATIYATIEDDWRQAEALLGSSYPTAGKVRPNKSVATALLARLYLYQKDWTKARDAATAIITSGSYQLLANLNQVFLTGSAETIWELFSEASPSGEGARFVPSSATVRPPFALTDSLLNAFETNDKRKASWLKTNTVSGQPYVYPFKYKQRSGTPITEYGVVNRLAEMYLVRAEARLELSDLAGAAADLNVIRTRAGLPSYTINSILQGRRLLLTERQVELFSEWGHRWLDLKRTGSINSVLTIQKGTFWQATDSLLPIPQTEINLNARLTQNPGY